MISVRRAGVLDSRPLADLLNEIIAQGGTTALTDPLTTAELQGWMTRAPDLSAWHLAEDEKGAVLGFQFIEPADYLPDEAAEIATFAKVGKVQMGIGSALFHATEQAARRLGFKWINANIRADNFGGLAYYQSRGFEDYVRKPAVALGGGLTVDKCLKRYNL